MSSTWFTLQKVKDSEVTDLFATAIGDKFAALNRLQENVDNLTENIHGALVDISSEVLGKAGKNKKPWIANSSLYLCDRRILKKRRKDGPLAMQNYSQVNQIIRRKMKQAKEN